LFFFTIVFVVWRD